MTLFLLDASHFQAGLPVASLRGQGFVGVILKATQGRFWVDPDFARQLAVARNAGLLVAAYHYLEPPSTTPLDAQARHAASVVPADVPLWVDAEGSTTRDHAYDFADAFRAAGGRLGGIYHGAQPKAGFGGWWRAGYFSDPTGLASTAYAAQGGDAGQGWVAGQTRHPDIWQFCQHGRVTGYGGDVDFNAYRGTLDQLVSSGWFWVPPSLEDPMPTATEIADAFYEKLRTTNVTDATGEADPQMRSATLLELAIVAGRHGYASEAKLDNLGKALAKVLAQEVTPADIAAALEAAVAGGVDVDHLADAIASRIPDSLAGKVVDLLAARLATP